MASVLAMFPVPIERNGNLRGSHIMTNRKFTRHLPRFLIGYLHHGTVVEDFFMEDGRRMVLVIQFEDLARDPTMCVHHPLCTTDNVSAIRLCCLDCFSKGNELYLFQYDQGFTASLRTTRSASPRDTEDAIVARAWDCHRLQNRGRWSILNNCESFAYFCSTGYEYLFGSKQVLRGGFLALKLF